MRSRASHGVSVLTVLDRESPEEETKNDGENEDEASPEKPTSNGSEVSASSSSPGAGAAASSRYPPGILYGKRMQRRKAVSPTETGRLQSDDHSRILLAHSWCVVLNMSSQIPTPLRKSVTRATGLTIDENLLFQLRNYDGSV